MRQNTQKLDNSHPAKAPNSSHSGSLSVKHWYSLEPPSWFSGLVEAERRREEALPSSGAEEFPSTEFTEQSALAGQAVEGEGTTGGWVDGQDTEGVMGVVNWGKE